MADAELGSVVDALPRRQAEATGPRYVDGLDAAVIPETSGRPEGSAKTHLSGSGGARQTPARRRRGAVVSLDQRARAASEDLPRVSERRSTPRRGCATCPGFGGAAY